MRTRSLFAFFTLVLTGALLIGCGDFFVDTSNCTAVNVTPTTASVGVGRVQQFAATCTLNSGGSQTITSTATWSSGTPTVATVNSAGMAVGLIPGSASITATSNGLTGTSTLTINPPAIVSIAVTSAAGSSVSHTTTDQFTATANFSDSSQSDITTGVTWSVDNTGIANISNTQPTQGLLTPVTTGVVNVTARLGTVSSNPFSLTIN